MWIDHDPGAAGGRLLGLRGSWGTCTALLDPSVELVGETWQRLRGLLNDRSVGALGRFGLLALDVRHHYERGDGGGGCGERGRRAPALRDLVLRRDDWAGREAARVDAGAPGGRPVTPRCFQLCLVGKAAAGRRGGI